MSTVTFYKYCAGAGNGLSKQMGSYPNPAALEIDNDSISKIDVPKGLHAQCYEHDNYGGRSISVFEGNKYNGTCLSGTVWNDMISSCQIRPCVGLYEHCGTNQTSCLPVGTYPNPMSLGVTNDTVSQIVVPPGYQAECYEHDNYGGKSIKILPQHVPFDYPGNDIKSFVCTKGNVDACKMECRDACMNHGPSCVAGQYGVPENTCWLKSVADDSKKIRNDTRHTWLRDNMNNKCLGGTNWNDMISSCKVTKL